MVLFGGRERFHSVKTGPRIPVRSSPTSSRQDVVVIEMHFISVLILQVRFEDKVDKLPVVVVVDKGDVGIVQFPI